MSGSLFINLEVHVKNIINNIDILYCIQICRLEIYAIFCIVYVQLYE